MKQLEWPTLATIALVLNIVQAMRSAYLLMTVQNVRRLDLEVSVINAILMISALQVYAYPLPTALPHAHKHVTLIAPTVPQAGHVLL